LARAECGYAWHPDPTASPGVSTRRVDPTQTVPSRPLCASPIASPLLLAILTRLSQLTSQPTRNNVRTSPFTNNMVLAESTTFLYHTQTHLFQLLNTHVRPSFWPFRYMLRPFQPSFDPRFRTSNTNPHTTCLDISNIPKSKLRHFGQCFVAFRAKCRLTFQPPAIFTTSPVH